MGVTPAFPKRTMQFTSKELSTRVELETVFCKRSYCSRVGLYVFRIRVCAVCEFTHVFDEPLWSGYCVPGAVLVRGVGMTW